MRPINTPIEQSMNEMWSLDMIIRKTLSALWILNHSPLPNAIFCFCQPRLKMICILNKAGRQTSFGVGFVRGLSPPGALCGVSGAGVLNSTLTPGVDLTESARKAQNCHQVIAGQLVGRCYMRSRSAWCCHSRYNSPFCLAAFCTDRLSVLECTIYFYHQLKLMHRPGPVIGSVVGLGSKESTDLGGAWGQLRPADGNLY
jgi:hypothetical protein